MNRIKFNTVYRAVYQSINNAFSKFIYAVKRKMFGAYLAKPFYLFLQLGVNFKGSQLPARQIIVPLC